MSGIPSSMVSRSLNIVGSLVVASLTIFHVTAAIPSRACAAGTVISASMPAEQSGASARIMLSMARGMPADAAWASSGRQSLSGFSGPVGCLDMASVARCLLPGICINLNLKGNVFMFFLSG